MVEFKEGSDVWVGYRTLPAGMNDISRVYDIFMAFKLGMCNRWYLSRVKKRLLHSLQYLKGVEEPKVNSISPYLWEKQPRTKEENRNRSQRYPVSYNTKDAWIPPG